MLPSNLEKHEHPSTSQAVEGPHNLFMKNEHDDGDSDEGETSIEYKRSAL